VKETS
jgi:hypothetical protein